MCLMGPFPAEGLLSFASLPSFLSSLSPSFCKHEDLRDRKGMSSAVGSSKCNNLQALTSKIIGGGNHVSGDHTVRPRGVNCEWSLHEDLEDGAETGEQYLPWLLHPRHCAEGVAQAGSSPGEGGVLIYPGSRAGGREAEPRGRQRSCSPGNQPLGINWLNWGGLPVDWPGNVGSLPS